MSSLSLPNYLVDDTSLQRWHRSCSWRKGRPAPMGGGGSSGVHAMDGQSGDGAREGETLGKGGSGAHSDKSGDDSSVAGGSLPSYAPSEASGIECDLNAADLFGPHGGGGAV